MIFFLTFNMWIVYVVRYLTLKRMHFYENVNSRQADSTPDQIMFKLFHFVQKTIFDICYQELFSFACELILFVEKWIRFDKGSAEDEVYHVVLVREKSDVLSLLDEGVVSGRLESFLQVVWSRGQQHLNMVLGAAGGLQADDEAVLEDKTEISKHSHHLIFPLEGVRLLFEPSEVV